MIITCSWVFYFIPSFLKRLKITRVWTLAQRSWTTKRSFQVFHRFIVIFNLTISILIFSMISWRQTEYSKNFVFFEFIGYVPIKNINNHKIFMIFSECNYIIRLRLLWNFINFIAHLFIFQEIGKKRSMNVQLTITEH